jgi:hypothetical protein
MYSKLIWSAMNDPMSHILYLYALTSSSKVCMLNAQIIIIIALSKERHVICCWSAINSYWRSQEYSTRSQFAKSCFIKWLGEYIGKLIFSAHICDCDIPFCLMISYGGYLYALSLSVELGWWLSLRRFHCHIAMALAQIWSHNQAMLLSSIAIVHNNFL